MEKGQERHDEVCYDLKKKKIMSRIPRYTCVCACVRVNKYIQAAVLSGLFTLVNIYCMAALFQCTAVCAALGVSIY